MHAHLNNYTERQMADQLLTSLGLDASRIVIRLTSPYRYDDLVKEIRNYYEPASQIHSLQISLRALQRTESQSAREFANTIQDLVAKAYPDTPQTQVDETCLQQFIYGQNDSATAMLLTNQPPNLDAAVNLLTVIEASANAKRLQGSLQSGSALANASYQTNTKTETQNTPLNPPVPTQRPPRVEVLLAEESDTPYSDQIDDIINATICCLSMASQDDDDDDEDPDEQLLEILSAKVRRKFPKADRTSKCYYCGRSGHMYMQCFKLLNKLQENGFRKPTHRKQPYKKYNANQNRQEKSTFQQRKPNNRVKSANVAETEVTEVESTQNEDLNS